MKNGAIDLFNNTPGNRVNLLPKDGGLEYFGKICTPKEADFYFDALLNNVDWRNDESIIFGKKIITKRKVGWYADEPYAYTYSNTTKHALPWTQELQTIKKITEQQTGHSFNSCLLNLYHNGAEGMGWHSDNEPELKKYGAIASLSFGAERKFVFRHKQSAEKVEIILAHGSLLLMHGVIQSHWLHRLPPTKLSNKPRINLTFRTIESNT